MKKYLNYFESNVFQSLIIMGVIACFTFFNCKTYAQEGQRVDLSGIVSDISGKPIPGVTVSLNRQKKIAVTDAQGQFDLRNIDKNDSVIMSAIGYERQIIPIANNRKLLITLNTASIDLNEVVVSVGYGTQKRGDVTGSVGAVNVEDLNKAPVKSADEALAGRVAGVVVSTTDGQPGANNNIVIRGAGSLTQSTAPLYVVDGFPMEDANFNSIAPGDIETIDILKDASATAIYGARGSNGVVIITTKRGKAGKPVVSYNGFFGMSQKPAPIELMNAYDFVKYQAELNPTITNTLYFTSGRDLEFYRNASSTDLQNRVFQSSPLQNHQFSLRGGSGGTTYSISGNLADQTGIVTNTSFQRYQGRIAIDQVINAKLKIGANLNYSDQSTRGMILGEASRTGGAASATVSLLYGVWGWRPVFGEGERIGEEELFDPSVPNSDARVNPIQSVNNEFRLSRAKVFNANAFINYEPLKGLVLRVSGGMTDITQRGEAFYNSLTSAGNVRNVNGVNGSVIFAPYNTLLNENTLTYTKAYQNGHRFDIMGGLTIQGNTSGNYGFRGLNVFSESLQIDGLDEAGTNIGSSSSSRWKMMSFLGRVNYSYKGKYLFTGTIRNDGSSKFRSGNRWAMFPAAALAWRMSDEKFFKSLNFIDESKLRLSYGSSGNNRVPDFPYLTAIAYPTFASYAFDNNTPARGALLGNYGNPDLRWETTTMANVGYDLSLFKNRIGFTVEVYRKVTKDALLNADLPYATGLAVAGTGNLAKAFKNIGKLENTGLEFTLNTVNISDKNFNWSSNFNISFNRNNVLQFNEGQTSFLSNVAFDAAFNNVSPYISRVGMPVGMMHGLIFEGTYKYSDFNNINGALALKDNVPDNGQPRANIKPGDIKYRDINGDLAVNDKDFTIIGRGLPIHTGGFTNNFKYKNFDLNIFLQWSYGSDIINANRLVFEGNAGQRILLNQYATYNNRWSADNPESDLPRTGGILDSYYSSRVIEDGSYLRLKTVAIGYNLSPKLVSKAKITSARISVSGQNLLTWSNYSGQNPDVSVRNSILTPGFDYSSYPLPRAVVVGIDVTF
ncbi:SusC/RagA family TonB-linked outer membrane protein [Parapedobacter sp. DT-150]|uniref:SusC/RagA family TonB-linked outer membrane protein n=1 Tax=Parapedobacter sp. DT-150 TaxID=3396162 RepID=UPI003F1B8578